MAKKRRQKPLKELDLAELCGRLETVEEQVYNLANDGSSKADDVKDAGSALKRAKAAGKRVKSAQKALDRQTKAFNELIAGAEAAIAGIPAIIAEIKARRDKLVAEANAGPEPPAKGE